MFLSSYTKNLRGPWMISPDQAAIMMPLLNATLQGKQIELDKTPEAYDFRAENAESDELAQKLAGKSVHVVHLQGTMMKYDSCGDPGTRSLGKMLLAADKEESVIGHLIVADSGGGNSNSVSELSKAIQKLQKPIVTFIDGSACSACMYAISYTDKIIAHDEYDMVGCIGTMIQLSGYKKFNQEVDGYVRARIYASKATDKNNDYEAALEGNAEIIRSEMLNPLNEQFINDMKANRPDTPDEQLTGKTYYAKDVVGTLIDGIGNMEDAIQAVIDLAVSRNDEESVDPDEAKLIPLDMSKYKFLEALPGLNDLASDPEDGSINLQPCQLDAIEESLARLDQSKEVYVQNEDLLKEIAQRDTVISAKDEQIQSLQNSLDAANKIIDDGQVPNPEPKADPENNHDNFAPAETFDEAVAACEEFLKNQN